MDELLRTVRQYYPSAFLFSGSSDHTLYSTSDSIPASTIGEQYADYTLTVPLKTIIKVLKQLDETGVTTIVLNRYKERPGVRLRKYDPSLLYLDLTGKLKDGGWKGKRPVFYPAQRFCRFKTSLSNKDYKNVSVASKDSPTKAKRPILTQNCLSNHHRRHRSIKRSEKIYVAPFQYYLLTVALAFLIVFLAHSVSRIRR